MSAINSDTAMRGKWRLPLSYAMIEPCAMVADALLVVAASVSAGTVYNLFAYGRHGELLHFLGLACVVAALVVPLAKLRGLYTPNSLLNVASQITAFAAIWSGSFLFLTGVVFSLKIGQAFSRGTVLSFALGGFVLLSLHRACWRWILRSALSSGRLKARRIVLIANGADVSASVVAELSRQGLRIAKHVELPKSNGGGEGPDSVGILAEALAYVRGSDIQEVFVFAGVERLPSAITIIRGLRVLPVPVRFVPDVAISTLIGRRSQPLGSSIAVEVQRAPLSSIELAAKRSVDLAIAISALMMLLPLIAVTSLAIKLDTPGPVLFRQQRRGFNGRPFNILKFRSMSVMEDGDVLQQARRHDPRVTRVGRWIRRTSIDELPQLINVVGGTMSLVGPRPHASAHDAYYYELIGNYAYRHHVKPGLTGWAQVNGSRGETPTVGSMARRIELDHWYVDNWSLWLDIRIMLRTIVELIRTKNAF